MDISVTTIEMADTTIVGNGDLTLSSNIENGTGPSANSPLIGGYLLIIIDEPHSQEHKDLILQKVSKGLLSWNKEQNLVNLEKELDIITTKAADGEVSRLNERLIQYASENLVTEILINATSNTVLQCIRNLLSSFTRHRHIIHAGYTFAGSGSWILQDGTFSYADMCDALQDTEVQRVFEAYENIVTIDIHCSPEGEWPKLDHEQFVRMCKLKTNPTDVLTAGTPSITNFMKYIEPYVIPMETDTLLESSDVVGNIRFSHPTLYIFPGGQGDSALFGINGFNMLIDGGFARKACFWDFTRHLDRLDAVLITRINNNNINGITAVLEKKRNQQVYPQIGHVFCNLQDRKKLLSPSEDKEKDPLLIDLIERSQQLVNCLRHINLRPQSCFRDTEPINLYHKVGHGTLNMYVLSPAKESREVREFMDKWNANDNKVFITRKDSKELIFPIQNMISICALLIWEPAKPNENITRILFPGSTPQHKIFEGLDKLKHLEFFKTPICSANTIVPSKSLTAITKMTKPVKSLDKVLQSDNIKPLKLATDIKKEKPSPPIIDNKQRSENKAVDDNKTKNIVADNKTKSTTSTIKYPKKTLKTNIKKSESVESDKDEVKTDEIKTKETDSETESKKLDEDKKVTKDDQKSSVSKTRSKSKTSKSIERKPRTEIKSDTKPSTPKKVASEQQGISNKFQAKSSPSATPAKSAKDANNRKVVESKYKSLYSKKEPSKPIEKDQPPKVERKPISRRPKPPSPMRKLGGSPVKSIKLNKNEKDSRKIKNEKSDTVDSSTVSTPVDVDSTKLANDVKLSETEIELLKAQELADLKEEQEVIKEIEAVFSKDEQNKKSEIESAPIPEKSIPDEVEEYLIIEKEEFVEYSQDVPADNGKTETTDISEEPEEKLKEIKQETEPVIQAPSRPTEFTTPITSTTKSKPISLESCNKIENEINEIIQSATDIAKTKEEGQSYDNDKKEKVEEISRDVSITSPEEKLELSSEKKTTDTKDIDEVENKEVDQNYVVESQPDEKFSATSGATTAPTLPEDERITLDEIKEDKVPDIEEKYINEETKEKDLPISIEPIRFEPKPKENDVRAMQYEAQQAHLRDIVKTPDEVADLPVHEEVDGGPYDHGHAEEQAEKDKQVDVNELKEGETQEKDVKLDDDVDDRKKTEEDQLKERETKDEGDKEKGEVGQLKEGETQEKDVKVVDDIDDKEKGDVGQLKVGQVQEKDDKLVDDIGDKEKGEVDQLKAGEPREGDVKLVGKVGDKEKGEVYELKVGEIQEKDGKLVDDIDHKEKGDVGQLKVEQTQEKDDKFVDDIGDKDKDEVDQLKAAEPQEKDVKLVADIGDKEKGEVDQLKVGETQEKEVKLVGEIDDKKKGEVEELELGESQEKDVKLVDDIGDKKTGEVDQLKAGESQEKDGKFIDDIGDKEKGEVDQLKAGEPQEKDVKFVGEIGDKEKGEVDILKVRETQEKGAKLDKDDDNKEKDSDQIPQKFDEFIPKKEIIAEKILSEKLENVEVEKDVTNAQLDEKRLDSDIVKTEQEINIEKESKIPVDLGFETSAKHQDTQYLVGQITDTVDTEIVYETVDEKELTSEQNVEKDTCVRKMDEKVSVAAVDIKLSKEETDKQEKVEISAIEEAKDESDKKLGEGIQEVIISKEGIEHKDKEGKVEISKIEDEANILDKKLGKETQELVMSEETTEKISTDKTNEIYKTLKEGVSKEEILKDTSSLDDKEKLDKKSAIILEDETPKQLPSGDFKLNGAGESDILSDSTSILRNLEEDKDDEADHLYAMKETWIRDNNEPGELRYSGIPTEFKEPFSSMPYTVNEYTTELRETHITTLDSPKPVEDNLESTILNNNKQSKLSTLLENSKELMESTSKIISDIKAQDTLKSEEPPSSTLGIDVVKLVANVAEVLKSDKSLEEIASTIKEDTDQKQDEEVIIASTKTYDNESIKKISPEPEKDEKIEAIPSEKCIKESILNFLNEERKAFDEVEDLEVNGDLEEEKDYDTEKQTPKTQKIEEDLEVSKYSTQPIQKVVVLDSEVSLPLIKDEKLSETQEISKLQQFEIQDGSSTLDKIEQKAIQEIQIDEKSITKSLVHEKSTSIIPENLETVDPALEDKDSIHAETSTEKPFDEDSISEASVKRKSIADSEISKSPTPEKSITDVKATTEEVEKLKSVEDEVKEKSKSPTPEKSITGMEISIEDIEKRKSITLEKSRSSTPEKPIVDKKDRSETPDKRKSIEGSETKESSKSPTPEKSIIDVKIANEEEEKQKMMEEYVESEISKSPTPDKSITDVRVATEEVEKRKSIDDSKAFEKSRSSTPEKSVLDQKHSSETADKFKLTQESEIKETSKSPTPEQYDTKATTEETDKKQSVEDTDKSKSSTPEKSITDVKSSTEEAEKRKSIEISETTEKSKSPTPERSILDQKDGSETSEKRKSIEVSETKETSKSPTPEISSNEVKRESIKDSIILDKSKSPSPEKILIDEKDTSEELQKRKSIAQSETQDISKSTEKSDSKEKTTPEVDEKLQLKSKSPTPEKSTIDETGASDEAEEQKSMLEKHSKSASPEKTTSKENILTIEEEKRKSVVESIVANNLEEMQLSSSELLDKSKSPSPEKSTSYAKDTSEEPEKRKSIVESALEDIAKSPSPAKSVCEKTTEKATFDMKEKSELPSDKSKFEQSLIDEKDVSKESEKGQPILESVVHDQSKSPSPEKYDSKEKVLTEEDGKRSSTKDSVISENEEKKVCDDEKQKLPTESVDKSKSSSPEKSTVDDKDTSEESEKRKSITDTIIHDQSKSPTPEKSDLKEQITTEKDEKRHSIKESQELPKSKSATPEKSISDEKDTFEESEKRKLILETETHDQQKSPSPEKFDSKQKDINEIEEKSHSIDAAEIPKLLSESLDESESSSPEKPSIVEKGTTEESEKRKSIVESVTRDQSKSPTPDLFDSKEQDLTAEEEEEEEKRHLIAVEIEEKRHLIAVEARKKRKMIADSAVQDTKEEATTDEKETTKLLSESLDKSKSPTPEKSDNEKESFEETEKRKSIIESSVHYQSKSPTPEIDEDSKEKVTTEIDEKRHSIGESVVQELPKSKSPTIEKSTIDEEEVSDETEKQKSIVESTLHDHSKSPTPEKFESKEKVTTEFDEKRQSIGSISKSPTPDKSTIDEEEASEKPEKQKSIVESTLRDHSKSPTPEKFESKEKVTTEFDEKRQSIGESAVQELLKSKSPTPDKSTIGEEETSEESEKQKSVVESALLDHSKSPTPEKFDCKEKVKAELDEKRHSIEESAVQELSKSPTPEKSTINDQSKSLLSEKSDFKEKLTTEIDEKRHSIGESIAQELSKSKSSSPERSTIDEKGTAEEPEKRRSIIESIEHDQSKASTPEKSDSTEKVTTGIDEKVKVIGESAVHELPKSKSPTPEKSIIDEKQVSDETGKRKSIVESTLHEQSKSPSPKKSDSNEKVTTGTDEKRQSIGESAVQELPKSKSPTPEKSTIDEKGISEVSEKCKSVTESDKSKSPSPEKSDLEENVRTGTDEKRQSIGESAVHELSKSKSPTPEKCLIGSVVQDQSKSPSPEKSYPKEIATTGVDEKLQSIGESSVRESPKSKSPTPEKSVIDEKGISEEPEKRKSIIESIKDEQSKSPSPEKSDYKEEFERKSKSPTPEQSAFKEKEILGKTEKSTSDVKTTYEESVKQESISESKEKSKSSTPEISADEKNIAETQQKLQTDKEQDKKMTEESKSPTPEKSIQEDKIISETQEKQLPTSEPIDEKVTSDTHQHMEHIEKSLQDHPLISSALEKSDTVEKDKSKISETQESIPESVRPEKTTVPETEKKQNLIGLEKLEEDAISKTQKTTTASIDKDSTSFTTIEKTKEAIKSDHEKVLSGKSEVNEILTNGHQTTHKIENGFDETCVLDRLKYEEVSDIDKQESLKSKTQTSTSTTHEKSEKQTTYGTKIVTNGVEINLEKSTSSKIVDMNGEGASDNTAKPIKTDDATISTSYSKTVDTKEIEILHTTNGTSDIQTSEIISAEKTEEISIIDPKTTEHSTIVTNGSATESSMKATQAHDQKERKSITEEKIPGISVDSPVKSTKKHTQSETTEDGDTHEEGCLSTENLSPLHLSGRSTPEIKIDLDVDRQLEKELLPLEAVDKTDEEVVVGTSSTKADIGVTSVIKQSMEDISGNLSGKSTPDIAEVEKLKEELKFEKYISKKTTSPKHTAGAIIKDSETICVMKASKITTEKHEVLTESSGKVIKEEIITTEEQSIERSPDLKLDKDSQHEITIETNTKIIKTVSEETHDVQTNGKHEHAYGQGAGESDKSKVVGKITEPLTLFSKTSEVLYTTCGDMDMGEVSSPPSNLSSAQGSCAPHIWDEHFTDEEDLPESPLSTTSQIGGSPTSQFQYDTGLNEDTILSKKQMDTMSTSFYGSLPEETVIDHSKTEPVLIPKKPEHFGVSSMSEEQTFIEPGTGISKHEFLSSDLKSKINVEKEELKTISKDEQEVKTAKCDEKTLGDTSKTKPEKVDKPESQKDSIGLKEQEQKPSSSTKPDSVESWGKPLGLPSPAPPGETKSTPKKERKTAASILAVKNKKNNERKRSESPGKLNKKINPVYLDLTYVPHHGNANYCYVDFFKKIRARYYVFSGTEPSREVYNALLEAKQTWEDKDLEVTIIPTYDTDVLGYWVAENEELLSKNKIDLSPSASRCTINLQDHETSCSAYRLEF
ncbi:microtubule-associated protein futsch [Chrysoperla carnea]|uniref:microtubule-associated protein futsch n=1 Tax=Chrysoperla carnea TaxID=189513 RepID=UPI001D088DBD|nr:microtubule-associated protein futsch [Chrysoperla carnea]